MSTYVFGILLGVALIGALSAFVGVFNHLLKRPLIADSIAHATLPGIALSFLLYNEKNLISLFIGACISALISIFFSDWLKRKSKLKNDSILAISLSCFFAIGLCLISYIQNQNSGQQTGLESYLFGNASSLNQSEVITAAIILSIFILIFVTLHKRFQLVLFNTDYASSIGIKPKPYLFIISLFTVLAVAIGVKAMGIVLASALLISPALAMRYWQKSFVGFFVASAIFGCISALIGTYLSSVYPDTPTGSAIVFCLFILVLISVLIGNNGGIIFKRIKSYKKQRKIAAENVLKLFYYAKSEENSQGDGSKQFHIRTLKEVNRLTQKELNGGLNTLCKNNIINKKGDFFELDKQAWAQCETLVRRHRLWELYLNEKLNLDEHHVHQDAEMVEHLIGEKIEAELKRILNNPDLDPHQKRIP